MAGSGERDVRRPYGLTIVLAILGIVLVYMGGQLAALGGSAYYVLAALTLFATATLVWRRDGRAAWLYAALTLATLLWALWETGGDPWAMLPRILAPAVLGLWFALPWVRRSLRLSRAAALSGPVLLIVALAMIWIGYGANAFRPVDSGARTVESGPRDAATDWTEYGGNAAANRFVATDQINRANVASLEVAWVYRTGHAPGANDPDFANYPLQVVPLELDDTLYFCTQHNVVIALDADAGRERWRFDPQVDGTGIPHFACRGVAHHESTGSGECASRLLVGTVDNRLIAIDRRSGQPCRAFGHEGAVDLKPGLGEFPPGYYYPTSPPIIAGDVAVVGAFIFDNQTTDLPPGVVRAYDVHTGDLVWAWDFVNPAGIRAPAFPAEYPRGTANYWSVGAYDADLGLIYLPTGNTAPDFYGGHRTPAIERYASSIVALDAASGDVRWSFQTVHHDIWDFDIGSQPVLVEFDTDRGPVPALIAPTKRGEIFVLDRRDGTPITEVIEQPVPKGAADGDWLSPTQPFSVGMPSFAPDDLTEADMWGATPIDQLWCRLRFARSRYDGQFTPQSTQGSVIHAGSFGIIDWGSVSLDPERGLMIVNTSGLPYYQKLIPRAEADRLHVRPYGTAKPEDPPPSAESFTMFAQAGTPYAIDSWGFLSPLGYPCNEPPWGTLAAVDLKRRETIWRRPLGTTEDVAPFGLALPAGVFNIGGTVTTRGGVTFVDATIDDYLRAFDTETGRELWKGRLPAGGQANPISYVSGKTGRQYVVIAAGGHGSLKTKPGDYIVAYALPQAQD
jgi:quinoprotein glucose dehydrogenase/quinate dehydrogenase (quinone)